jgi:hypothetical protein
MVRHGTWSPGYRVRRQLGHRVEKVTRLRVWPTCRWKNWFNSIDLNYVGRCTRLTISRLVIVPVVQYSTVGSAQNILNTNCRCPLHDCNARLLNENQVKSANWIRIIPIVQYCVMAPTRWFLNWTCARLHGSLSLWTGVQAVRYVRMTV